MRYTRKELLGVITLIIALVSLFVTLDGVTSGTGVIPGLSFLLWALIALTYATHEEIEEYIRNNHGVITQPLDAVYQTTLTQIQGRSTKTNQNKTKPSVTERLTQSRQTYARQLTNIRLALAEILDPEGLRKTRPAD